MKKGAKLDMGECKGSIVQPAICSSIRNKWGFNHTVTVRDFEKKKSLYGGVRERYQHLKMGTGSGKMRNVT